MHDYEIRPPKTPVVMRTRLYQNTVSNCYFSAIPQILTMAFLLFFVHVKFTHLSLFYQVILILYIYYKPSSLVDEQSHSLVEQNVISNILVPEVMKLIWWSVSDMANKQNPCWSWRAGSSALLCSALFCIVKDRELLP